MVWAGVIGGHVIGPYFFEGNVTGESYLAMLQNFVIPQLNAHRVNHHQIWFQQDGAPAHYSANVKEFCDANFYGWIGRGGNIAWPARSPDHNPMDFFVWPYLKNKVYTEPRPSNMIELRHKIKTEMENIPEDTLQNVRENLVRRLNKCIELNGGHVTNQGI